MRMDTSTQDRLEDIKARIRAMLGERASFSSGESRTANPSEFWSAASSAFAYLIDLPPEHLEGIRLHTHWLDGDHPILYDCHYSGFGEASFWRHWSRLTEALPAEYVIEEPQQGFGYVHPTGKMVSRNTIRFQRVIRTFVDVGILPLATGGSERPTVLEIGAGYGGLGHHLAGLPEAPRYVIVDLPEVLLISAVYLTLTNPDKTIHLYAPGEFDREVPSEVWGSSDFLLVPNYRLESLADAAFDLAINMVSFQEMRTEQVETYLDFVARTSRALYSRNLDSQECNTELDRDLREIIGTRFDVQVLRGIQDRLGLGDALYLALRRLARAGGLVRRAGRGDRYIELLCTPRLAV